MASLWCFLSKVTIENNACYDGPVQNAGDDHCRHCIKAPVWFWLSRYFNIEIISIKIKLKCIPELNPCPSKIHSHVLFLLPVFFPCPQTTANTLKYESPFIQTFTDAFFRSMNETTFMKRSVYDMWWGYKDPVLEIGADIFKMLNLSSSIVTGKFGFYMDVSLKVIYLSFLL